MRSNIRLTAPLLLALLVILAACGGDDTDTDSPTTTSEPPAPASSPPASPMAENPGFEVAEASDEEPFTKPTPPGGIVPTAPPPMDSSFDSDGDGFLDPKEYAQELEAVYSTFEFPPGYGIDIEAVISEIHQSENQAIRFEVGYAYTAIGLNHMCAWWMVWLEAYSAEDQDSADKALQVLEEVSLSIPTFAGLKSDIEHWIRSAQLGDPAPILAFVDASCLNDPHFFTPADLQRWVNNNCDFAMPYFTDAEPSASMPDSTWSRQIPAGGN